MKRTVIAVLLVVLGGQMVAQAPAPQRDTIVGREVTYHYISQWVDPYDSVIPDNFLHDGCFPQVSGAHLHGDPCFVAQLDRLEYAELHVIDSTLDIIGIAVCPFIDTLEPIRAGNRIADPDWRHVREYVRLYEHVGDTMRQLASETFDLVDTTRWMEYGTKVVNGDYLETNYLPVVERYFEKPVTVRDSFYLSCTFRTFTDTNQLGQRYNLTMYYLLIGGNYYRMSGIRVAERGSENSRIPDWVFFDLIEGGGVAPIFLFAIFDTTGMSLGPRCDSVYHLNQGSVWGNNTMLLWDSTAGQVAWQLAVGRADADPEGYRVYDVETPSKALYNLEYNTTYAARVRARCNGRNNYGAWSDTIQFTLSDPQGIGAAVDCYTHLFPNPASDRIAVFSSFALVQVEVYDLNGRRMWVQDCEGHSSTIDVGGWQEGTYIAVVRTIAGTTSQKVTVARK